MAVVPFSLTNAPSLIEKILPVQKLSAESYKEQMANVGKTLTSLGSYWKGRKPLILNKACVLGSLLPVTDNLTKDLEVFEMLMGMDSPSLAVRLGLVKPQTIVETIALQDIRNYFTITPDTGVPQNGPFHLKDYRSQNGTLPKVAWRPEVSIKQRRIVAAGAIPSVSYREILHIAKRTESCLDIHDHIWGEINGHLGTSAHSMPELVEQLGIMRFGHRPRVADSFAGSGQIPFEAARLGCDVIASDLNPIACLLTWGAMNIVGGSIEQRNALRLAQSELVLQVGAELDKMGTESDGFGYKPKFFLYCVEVLCPETGWKVPLLSSRIVSKDGNVIVEMVANPEHRRYELVVRSDVSKEEFAMAERGTVRKDGRGQEPYLYHVLNGKEYRTKISTLRGDYLKPDGTTGNRLRQWDKTDIVPRVDDIFQERLYAIGWIDQKQLDSRHTAKFRTVTKEDLLREKTIEDYLADHFLEWQQNGWIPDMKIEPGDKTDEPIRTRGWTHWQHLFNPRQLVVLGLVNRYSGPMLKPAFAQLAQYNSRLCMWNSGSGGRTGVMQVFSNQALNTMYNYGCQGWSGASRFLTSEYKSFPLNPRINIAIKSIPAEHMEIDHDLAVTDPPYGDAVKYEEITEFFIAWLRRNVPPQFSSWTWDSRRSLAIKGEDDEFRLRMVAAYKRMADMMPDNGIQVIMFTHQSGTIWADMANIVWASGLQVTAAWYVATETDNPLRDGNYVKGTVLLVVRKRIGNLRTTQDDLAWDIQDEVQTQVETLIGLNQQVKQRNRDENIFEDADIQMAGYAAALRVLTKYDVIDGKSMGLEALRPRPHGQKTFVDELIDFAVEVANQSLIPQGIEKSHWDRLSSMERFYLKLVELEARGIHNLDNYQNFAKAFKVKRFETVMANSRANSARLKTADELGRAEMSGESEFGGTLLRSLLYAVMELVKDIDGTMVLAHLAVNVDNYYDEREALVALANYLARKMEVIRPEEATAARVLRELIRNQRV